MASQTNENICRLCLIVDDIKYSQLDEISKESLKAIVPDLNLDVPAAFVVCSKCNESIENSFSFMTITSKNEDLIRLEKERLNISDKVNLNNIFKADLETGSNGEQMCRLCLNKNGGNYTDLNKIADNVLETCLLALDKNLTCDPAVCEVCQKSLQEMHSFKTECLSLEEKIKAYCESAPDAELSLHKLVSSSKDGENDFLAGFEIQDEEGGDIFDSIPSEIDIEIKRKRSASESIDIVPPKLQKVNDKLPNILEDELPYFNFHFSSIYNPYRNDTVDDWLVKVDEIKAKQNWSDYITINKVLARMKQLQELCTWFSNISDIMNWEEWKKKLINAFPRKDDYLFALKRMAERKKKVREPYAKYFDDKMLLLEPLGIAGEKAVSCILGGVPNHVIASIGRVGQYKTPEDLLVYFKSCDDKAAVEASDNSADNKESEHTKGFNKPEKEINEKEKLLAEKRCFVCRKTGHIKAVCRYRDKAHMLEPQANMQAKNNACDVCGKFGHKRATCIRRQRDIKQKQTMRSSLNNLHVPSSSNTNKGSNRPKPKIIPSNLNIVIGPNNPNANKGVNNTGNKGPRKRNTSTSPSHPAVTIKKKRPRNRGSNGPNRNTSPKGPNTYENPAAQNMNRNSNRPNPNRGSHEVNCSYCGNLGHTVNDCLVSNFLRQNQMQQQQTQEHDRQAGRYSRSNAGHVPSGQNYVGSYSNQKQMSNVRHLCLNCYQMGHDTKDCTSYDRSRSYAH